MREEILFLSEQDVCALLSPKDAIDMAEDTFLHVGLGDITVGAMTRMFTDATQNNNFHSMPAILHHKEVAGVKWIDTFSAPLPGYPFSHGNLIILSSTVTGSPLAIVGATNITAMRTAGGHGVVQAKHLANPDPEVLSVLGCGTQAKAGVYGFLEQFPSLRQIRIFSRSREPMEALKTALRDRVEVIICSTPAETLIGSNLVLAASGATGNLLTADQISPGTTIIGIEGFRDLDPEIARKADKWYLGYRVPDQFILKSPKMNPGLTLTEADVFGDMTQLLSGQIPGRESPEEIIISTHMGMGAHDVNCAHAVYHRALERGFGIRLVLDQ